MKTTFSVRFVKRLALTTALAAATLSAAHADDLNIKTMIPGVPQIDAESYILIDYNSGKVLAEQNADARRDPASLTKMMTSYVIGQAMKAGKFKETDLVTIGNDAWATGNPVFKGSSLMFLKPGMQVPVSQLIRGINLQSGNDACVAMADYVAGSQDAFVGLMNSYVTALGLKNSHFQTVHGLDADGQFSSARDMALIGQALIRDVPNEYTIYKEKEFTFNGIRQTNRNGLLWDNSLNVDGIKTGHTDKAGYNLVASATEGQMRLISAVMGGRTFKGREAESKKLLTWGFRFFETVNPIKAGKEFASEPAWFGDSDRASLGVVIAAGGYPGNYRTGDVIHGLPLENIGGKVFHAGTTLADDDQVLTSGGRVLCATALGNTVAEAQKNAYALMADIHWEGSFSRQDIGYRAIAREQKQS